MKMPPRLDLTLRGLLPTLSPAETRVARVFLHAVETQSNPRVAQVAEQARTSTASVVRLYQRLGYERFSDFWIDLTLSSRASQSDDIPTAGRLRQGDSLADVVASLRTTEQLSLSDTADSLDLTALERAVSLVSAAPRVDLFGIGASAVVTADLQQKLCRIGLAALRSESPHVALTTISAAPGGTVAIAVSHSGETAAVVEFAAIAGAAGIDVISITNVAGSALAARSDVVLTTAAQEAPFRAGALTSRTAQLLVSDCLYIGVALATYDRSMAALRSTYGVIEEVEDAAAARSAGRRRGRPSTH